MPVFFIKLCSKKMETNLSLSSEEVVINNDIHNVSSEKKYPIPGATRYLITKRGEVYSTCWNSLKKLKPKNNKGYYCVRLKTEEGNKDRYIHLLMLEVFVEKRPIGKEKYQARHLNGNSLDNRIENLKWGTVTENMRDKNLHGTSYRGEKHYRSKLTEQQVLYIRKIVNKDNYSDIAKEYNVDKYAIRAIMIKRTWAWLV